MILEAEVEALEQKAWAKQALIQEAADRALELIRIQQWLQLEFSKRRTNKK